MKIKLLILYLLITGIQATNAQADKYGMLIETSLTRFLGWEGSHGGTHRIAVGSNSVSKGSNTEDETVVEYDFFYVTGNPASIVCRGSTAGNRDGSDCQREKTIPYDAESFDSSSFSGCIGSSRIMGIYLPQPTETNICETKVINLTRGWNWEYSYDGISWIAFPAQYQAKRSISFTLKDLTGYAGKLKLYIHAGFKRQFTSKIFYDIIPCPPSLEVAPEAQKTTCVYNNDGKVILKFDRKLADNERFLFNFFKTPGDILIATPSFSVDEATNKIYTFSGLEQGKYYLRYQTFIGAQQTSVSNPPDPSFTISPPDPVRFEVNNSQPLCHDNNGQINIKAWGGTPPYYCQINSGAEIEFTAPIDVASPGGDYYIKVRDKYNCIDEIAND